MGQAIDSIAPEQGKQHNPATPTTFTRWARRTFTIGGISFIAIGTLHTVTHIRELAGRDLEQRFRTMGTIEVSSQTVESWDLFQGISLLMGFFSIAIGLIDLGSLRATARHQPPPTLIGIANMVVLAAVVGIGLSYLGPLQVYGGIFGIGLFGLAVAANFSPRPQAP